jgi:carbon-monoxide dehydrogenase medium subunit
VSAGTCTAASIAIGGLVPAAVRATAVEQALTGKTVSADVVAAAADQIARDLGNDILGDIFASAEYRKAVAPVWVRRAVSAAAERAR